MANNQNLSPQGYNINENPMNKNPFWEADEPGTGGNVPPGGTTGQVLTKNSATDYDTSWQASQGVTEGQLNSAIAGANAYTDESITNVTSTLTGQIQAQVTRIDAHDTHLAQLDATQQAQDTEISTLSEQIADETTARIAKDNDLQTQIDNIEIGEIPDITELQDAVSNLENVTSELHSNLNNLEATVINNKTEADADISAVQNNLDAYIATNDARQDTQDAQIEAANSLAESAADDAATALASATAASTAIEGINSSISDLETITNGHTESLANLTEDVQNLSTDVQGVQTDILALQGDVGEINTNVDALTARVTANETATTPLAGGTTGQVLTKTSGDNFAYTWQTPSGGGGGGTTREEVLLCNFSRTETISSADFLYELTDSLEDYPGNYDEIIIRVGLGTGSGYATQTFSYMQAKVHPSYATELTMVSRAGYGTLFHFEPGEAWVTMKYDINITWATEAPPSCAGWSLRIDGIRYS